MEEELRVVRKSMKSVERGKRVDFRDICEVEFGDQLDEMVVEEECPLSLGLE